MIFHENDPDHTRFHESFENRRHLYYMDHVYVLRDRSILCDASDVYVKIFGYGFTFPRTILRLFEKFMV